MIEAPPAAEIPVADPWMHHVRRGEFARAWEISDAALRARAGIACHHLPRHEQWIWDGAPLAGKRVLIRCYHGLGDTIQFIRYAPLVKAVAAEVIVWAQPALLGLLRGAAGVDRLLALHDGAPEAEYDAEVEIMELPHVFRTTLETIPARVPYLGAGPLTERAALMAEGKGGEAPAARQRGPAVGLVWRAGDWNARRSVPLDALAGALRGIPGVTLHALQQGAGLADWRAEYGPTAGSSRVEDAARAMAALDLIITVDSFPAHLAGALDRPVWTLLHAEADWRWMLEREDSPWYPTMRLFRQERARAGDWGPVIERVAGELRRLGEM